MVNVVSRRQEDQADENGVGEAERGERVHIEGSLVGEYAAKQVGIGKEL